MSIDPKMMEKAFEAAQSGKGSENLNLTPDEAERFKKAFDDPEFCKLMSDYVGDLQNPEYRAETESYISELEGENKVPAGKELVRPTPGFVAKLYKKKTDGQGDKVFINIVSSDKITKPTSINSDKGQNWSLPYSVGPPHMESDKGGTSATAFDVCFHPEALRQGRGNKRFRDLLVRTGMDGVQQAYRLQQQDVSLSEDFHVLKGVVYKSGQVPTMLIDKALREEKWNSGSAAESAPAAPAAKEAPAQPSAEAEQEAEGAEAPRDPAPSISANKPAQHNTTVTGGAPRGGEPAIKKGFLGGGNARKQPALYPEGSSEGTPVPAPPRPLISELKEPYKAPVKDPASQHAAAAAAAAAEQEGADLKERKTVRRAAPAGGEGGQAGGSGNSSGGDKAPVFRVKERGVISMGDFDGVSKNAGIAVESNRPAELVYTLELPLVSKPSRVQLDVSERHLKLRYEDVYDLSVRFAYDVLDKKGTAKYDKASKTLTVTVPVRPAEQQRMASSVAEVAETETEAETETGASAAAAGGSSSPSKKKESHSRWVTPGEKAEAEAGTEAATAGLGALSLSEEIAAKAQEALERHREQLAAAPPKPKAAPAKQGEQGEQQQPPYIASKSFVGRKSGYCFKTGEAGLGYYLDMPFHMLRRKAHTPPAQAQAAAAAGAVFDPFVFEYRQTKEALAVLVQVPNISGDSVQISFSSSGFNVAFAAVDKEGKTKLYSMSFLSVNQLSEAKCKYDVASLNMVVALTKKEAAYWREDGQADTLSPFEARLQASLPQPVALLRLAEGSPQLQAACLAALGKTALAAGGKPVSTPVGAGTGAGTGAGAASSTPAARPAAAAASGGSAKTAAPALSPPPAAGSKMKFTMGALLDLD
jgi:hypothetical protein